MPKVLVIGSVDKVGPWIDHLQSTVLKVEAVKPGDLTWDQRHGIDKCKNIDAVFVVISNTDRKGYLANDCARIKDEINEGLKSVPAGTPVFIVLAGSSENELNNFKTNFSLAEGTHEATQEKVYFHQIGKQASHYVSSIFGYRASKDAPHFSDAREALTPESLQKTRGIKRIKVVAKPSTSSSKTADTEEKGTKPKVTRIGNETGEEGDQAQNSEKKDEPKTKKETKKEPPKKNPQEKPKPPIITIQKQPEVSGANHAEKRSQSPKTRAATNDGGEPSETSNSNSSVQPPQAEAEPKSLLKRILRSWEIDLPTSAMAFTAAGLGFLVMLSELIAVAFGASLIMKSGLLAGAIAGTALASLTPAGVVLIGIIIVAFIVGIAAFCYFNRENLFGIPQEPLPPSPEERVSWQRLARVEPRLGRQNNLSDDEIPLDSFVQVFYEEEERGRSQNTRNLQPEGPIIINVNEGDDTFGPQ